MSPEAHDFIDRLLTLDPKKRLGANEIDEVKKHPFLDTINWSTLMKIKAPFRPVGRE